MHLKSDNQTIKEIVKLPDNELFRAYHKAFSKGNMEFCNGIMRQLSAKKRWRLSNLHYLAISKLIALHAALFSKASLAISFYNSLLSSHLGMDYPKELYDDNYRKDRMKETDTMLERIKEMDIQANGALDLEEYGNFAVIETELDYWLKVLEEISGSEHLQRSLEPLLKTE